MRSDNFGKPVPDVASLKYRGTPEKPDIKIFVSHRIDLDSETIDNPLYIPVRCGAVYDQRKGTTMLGDDTGNNISEKRDSFCELTVQYWAWKNIQADYYGLCHYRRYFLFSKDEYGEDMHGRVICKNMKEAIEEYNLADYFLASKTITAYDIIVGSPEDFAKENLGTIYAQYKNTPELKVEDLECALNVLNELYPEFADSARIYMNGHIFYPTNLFIMKREIYQKYCLWLFDILAETERRIDISEYSVEGARCLAHIAERLLGVYYTYIKRHCPQYKTCTLQRLFITNTSTVNAVRPAYSKKNIPIVFACSDYYIPYVAQTVQSIIEHSTEAYNYDLIFLHTGITENNQRIMQTMVDTKKNFSLRFIDVENYMSSRVLSTFFQYSVETYYRLLIPQILYEYKKVIYLDSDVTVLHDIAKLMEIEIGNNLLAAARDVYVAGQYNADISGIRSYCDNTLRLKKPFDYFQAGVLVINVDAFRKSFKENELLDFAEKRTYTYVDQDVLNAKCNERVYILPMNWNIMTDCSGENTSLSRLAPKKLYWEYITGRKDPYIVHHTGGFKPWDYPYIDLAEIYWKYARKTPFYEVLICRLIYRMVDNQPDIDTRSSARKFADKLLPKGTRRRNLAKKILPKGSRRWNFCKKAYYKIFRR